MDLFEDLKVLGVNIDDGLRRLNGNATLYKRLLNAFVGTLEKYYIDLDFDENNCTEITEKAHAIKGIAGNLSITPLYKSYTQIVDLLRANKSEDARKILEISLPVQEEIVNCIKKHIQ